MVGEAEIWGQMALDWARGLLSVLQSNGLHWLLWEVDAHSLGSELHVLPEGGRDVWTSKPSIGE